MERRAGFAASTSCFGVTKTNSKGGEFERDGSVFDRAHEEPKKMKNKRADGGGTEREKRERGWGSVGQNQKKKADFKNIHDEKC